MDRLIQEASGIFDPALRGAVQRRAMEGAMADVAVIPLYTNILVWATRRNVIFVPSADEGTLAMRIQPER